MSAELLIATPIEPPPLTEHGVVCGSCDGLDQSRWIADAWKCDRCEKAGRTPAIAHAERIARGLPATFVLRLPPEHVVKHAIDRHVYPPVFLTAQDERAHQRWLLAKADGRLDEWGRIRE